MEQLFNQLSIRVNEKLYLKNPESSELGQRIISNAICLIAELGFEKFTFKKLGDHIQSPESTIYRYFENKHMLLIYLTSWYWGWLEYRLVFATANLNDPAKRLESAIQTLAEEVKEDAHFGHINEQALYQIVITEANKAMFTKNVDKENKEGYFSSYKRLVKRFADLIEDVNPQFPYARSLVSTLLEGVHQQQFFAEHMPSLTDFTDQREAMAHFFTTLVFKTINTTQK